MWYTLCMDIPLDRFWAKVIKTDSCWLWVGAKNNHGYGQIRINQKCHYAHRLSYEMSGKSIPDKWVIDHLCRNPSCIRPDHLEAVDERTNLNRGHRWLNRRKNPIGAQKNGEWYTCRKSFEGVSVYLGNYRTAEEASIAYQTAILKA